jgi:hypothetical protein
MKDPPHLPLNRSRVQRQARRPRRGAYSDRQGGQAVIWHDRLTASVHRRQQQPPQFLGDTEPTWNRGGTDHRTISIRCSHSRLSRPQRRRLFNAFLPGGDGTKTSSYDRGT